MLTSLLFWISVLGSSVAQATDAKVIPFPGPTATKSISEPSPGTDESCAPVLTVLPGSGRSNTLQAFPQIRELAERTDKTAYTQAIRHTLSLMEHTEPTHEGWRGLWVPLLLNELVNNRISAPYGLTQDEIHRIDLHLLAFAQAVPGDRSALRIVVEGLADFLVWDAKPGRESAPWREHWIAALSAIHREIDLDSAPWERFKVKAQEVWVHPPFVRLRHEKQKIRTRKRARDWLDGLTRLHQILELD